MNYPKISIVVPTLNEEKNIKYCLESIFNQKYPIKKIEVIIVDNFSTDNTLDLLKNYSVRVIKNPNKHGEISKMIGFKKATGDYVVYLDADIELKGRYWFQKMLKPLNQNSEVIGSFTKFYSKINSPAIERYLNLDPLQRDSIYKYFSPSIEETIVEEQKGYFLCKYIPSKIPPAGLCLYRRKQLMNIISSYDMFLELDFLYLLVSKGMNKFAYVPKAGLYHKHISSLSQLLKKRKYNLQNVYLGRKKRLYTWFDMKRDFIKIIFWVIYANLFIPSLLIGIYKSIKHKDIAGMYEPFVNLLVTDELVLLFLLNNKGRNFIFGKLH